MPKGINKFILGGNCYRKTFMEGQGRLYVTLSCRVPEMSHERNEPTQIVTNFPSIIFEGDLAKRVNRELDNAPANRSRYLFIGGHIETERLMQHVGGPNYRRTFRTVCMAEEVMPSRRPSNMNYVFIKGKIVYHWHSDAPDKKFYIITIETGTNERVQITYFNRNMDLNPAVGEEIAVFGRVQTDRVRNESDGKYTYYLSVVAKEIYKQGYTYYSAEPVAEKEAGSGN